MQPVRTITGRPRAKPRSADGMHQHEIEPGRSVVNDWDRYLFEPWAERKARLAEERDGR